MGFDPWPKRWGPVAHKKARGRGPANKTLATPWPYLLSA